ncbi:MAG: nucleotidyltransferase domain-containing protein [Bacteroidia bacterium]|nr:nucleotidyltransferase domain-containing protein [Bacteroidia bacterium]
MVTGQKRIYFLNRYINGGYFTPSGGMLSVFSPKFLFRRNSAVICKLYSGHNFKSEADKEFIDIPAYTGSNQYLAQMAKALTALKPSLKAVLVHGSYATGEEIAYSDFDGLIIISKEALHNRKQLSEAAYNLHELRKYMHLIDPFQHHGWFVLSEYDLENYPEWFLPTAVLHHSKSLLGNTRLEINVQEVPDVDFKRSFLRLCDSLKRKLSASKSDWNIYQLKAIFSEFMMLPSAYVQARDDKGIFKKYSFAEMRRDFTDDEFAVMDEVSNIRLNWMVDLTDRQKKFFERIDFLSWKGRQKIELSTPVFIELSINNGIFSRMNNFTALVKHTILNSNKNE